MEWQMHDKWNFLRHPRLTSGGEGEIYYDATNRNLNTMYYVLKQYLRGLELIRAHCGIFYSSPMFN